MLPGIKLAAETLQSISFSDLSTTFAAIGSESSNPAHIYALQNFTDQGIYWSWDGINNHGYLGANGGHIILDVTTNKKWEQGLYIEKGTVTYVATVAGDTAPTTGSVYLSLFYSAPLN